MGLRNDPGIKWHLDTEFYLLSAFSYLVIFFLLVDTVFKRHLKIYGRIRHASSLFVVVAASKNWFSPYFSRKRLSQLVVSQAVFTLLVQSDWLSAVWSIHESHLVLNRIISVLNRTIVALYCIISVSGTKWDVLLVFTWRH